MITAKNAAKQAFMPVLRELVRTYQAFSAVDAAGLKAHGLTVAQGDVLFTLGNTAGLSFREIGELTLITKGTLTGVVDRMESKGLVMRHSDPADGRSTLVTLTDKGERLFEKVFPGHIASLKSRFDRLSTQQLTQVHEALRTLRQVFEH